MHSANKSSAEWRYHLLLSLLNDSNCCSGSVSDVPFAPRVRNATSSWNSLREVYVLRRAEYSNVKKSALLVRQIAHLLSLSLSLSLSTQSLILVQIKRRWTLRKLEPYKGEVAQLKSGQKKRITGTVCLFMKVGFCIGTWYIFYNCISNKTKTHRHWTFPPAAYSYCPRKICISLNTMTPSHCGILTESKQFVKQQKM